MNKVQKYNSSILGELLNEVSPKVSEKTRKRMLLAGRIEDAIVSAPKIIGLSYR